MIRTTPTRLQPRWILRTASLLAALLVDLVAAVPAAAQAENVAGTLHNLSVSGPGEIRAVSETEVCKFCHVPHNAIVPVPLWGHALSEERYAVPEVSAGGGARRSAPQPDGSSRLCLSCHDGTVALGEIARQEPIAMRGRGRLTAADRGFLGTDLTGSHPVSFELPDDAGDEHHEGSDMAARPLSEVKSNPLVRIDANNRMQCTTCHDAHSDRYYVPDRVPRFWVAPTVDEVCLSCHVLR